MKNTFLHEIKKFFQEGWVDFKKPIPYQYGVSTCHCYEPSSRETHLRPAPILVKDHMNIKKHPVLPQTKGENS